MATLGYSRHLCPTALRPSSPIFRLFIPLSFTPPPAVSHLHIPSVSTISITMPRPLPTAQNASDLVHVILGCFNPINERHRATACIVLNLVNKAHEFIPGSLPASDYGSLEVFVKPYISEFRQIVAKLGYAVCDGVLDFDLISKFLIPIIQIITCNNYDAIIETMPAAEELLACSLREINVLSAIRSTQSRRECIQGQLDQLRRVQAALPPGPATPNLPAPQAAEPRQSLHAKLLRILLPRRRNAAAAAANNQAAFQAYYSGLTAPPPGLDQRVWGGIETQLHSEMEELDEEVKLRDVECNCQTWRQCDSHAPRQANDVDQPTGSGGNRRRGNVGRRLMGVLQI
ncbi:hypothetical protein CTheo_3805 [Ceratobasidium theobromae]|uniref:Uncharacterized protein n=1 Tax=Ceratobasidium theobromae TaxID=1582974 RepID=A0A5N5QNA8_9AGAM|nr:hypothetical protein CTheo_3805 [Ceratobasidium theobromae]